MLGPLSSEYGRSFNPIVTAQQEYCERLKFRMKKRDREYSHQPFHWNLDNDFNECLSSDIDFGKTVLSSGDASNSSKGRNFDKLQDKREECILTEKEDTSDTSPYKTVNKYLDEAHSKENSPSKTDASTQTERIKKLPKPQKAFVPYALGSSNGDVGAKLTFNVKSGCDVYPSAVRANARRRERFSVDRSDADSATHSTDHKAPQPEVVVDRCPDVHNSSVTCRARKQGTMHSKSISDDPIGTIASDTNWLSEYHQKYPVYPTSIYVRSASTAASRCRPFSASSTRQTAVRNLESVVPKNPVLLSSRGSVPHIRRPIGGEHGDVYSLHSARSFCPAPLLSAR